LKTGTFYQVFEEKKHWLKYLPFTNFLFLCNSLKYNQIVNKTPNLIFKKYEHLNSWVRVKVRVVVFNATFNNISVISWQSVLLVEETGLPGENYRPVASH
jgi:hypothetical protein